MIAYVKRRLKCCEVIQCRGISLATGSIKSFHLAFALSRSNREVERETKLKNQKRKPKTWRGECNIDSRYARRVMAAAAAYDHSYR